MGHIYSKWYLFGNTHGWSCHHWRLIHRVAPDPNPALRSLYWVSQHVSTKTRGTNFTAVLFREMQHLHSKWHSESQKVALENDSFQTQVPSHRAPMWTPPLHRQRGHTPARFVRPTRGKFRHSTSWSSLVIPGKLSPLVRRNRPSSSYALLVDQDQTWELQQSAILVHCASFGSESFAGKGVKAGTHHIRC